MSRADATGTTTTARTPTRSETMRPRNCTCPIRFGHADVFRDPSSVQTELDVAGVPSERRSLSAEPGVRAADAAAGLQLAERVREETPAGVLSGRLALGRRAAVDAADEPVEHPERGRALEAE